MTQCMAHTIHHQGQQHHTQAHTLCSQGQRTNSLPLFFMAHKVKTGYSTPTCLFIDRLLMLRNHTVLITAPFNSTLYAATYVTLLHLIVVSK